MQKTIKIFICLIISSLSILSSFGQELVSKGLLEPVEYVFTGRENYRIKKTLTHALAYSYSKDVGEIKAKVSYTARFQTIRIGNNGFKTIVRLGPKEISGHTELLHFDFSDVILPELKSISLFIYKDDDLIYVKDIADLEVQGKSLYFTFMHQRFAKDWHIELKNPKWEFQYDEAKFIEAWDHIANYQIAQDWVNDFKSYSFSSVEEEYILKTRILALLKTLEDLEFYQFTERELLQDPLELHRQTDICLFKFEKDLELLKNQYSQPPLKDFAHLYFSFENYLLNLHQNNTRLYGDLYHAFDSKEAEYFSFGFLTESLSDSSRNTFDHYYQKLSLEFINQLIVNKQTPEALFQINRFQAFYENSEYLNESGTFKNFKARAVYDIYLSYIQVSKQALEHNQIDMAIKYLDKASNIQKNYSSEIINNILVEKEMRNLIKQAMSRYQILLEEGKTDTAKKVKEGIMGLMKKLGIEASNYPIGYKDTAFQSNRIIFHI